MAATIRGLDRIEAMFRELTHPRCWYEPMTKAVAHLHNRIAEYPPATAANSPPGRNGYSWYERGYGTKTVTGKAFPTSETLGRSWTTEVEDNGKRGLVGTNVSYGPYVQDGERQASFHARNGWKTDATIAEEEGETVTGFFDGKVKAVIK
ncbi:MAG TPA: hypothetical protein PKJ56_00400 [Promineifilum sp.]|nr:hypothetical protein [Promineifilum sp.]